ncbi:CRE-NHR-12 protein [Caenorhabditis remanei]|uniref:CRE-NHR-12 protein n=1 Tax=Caenorhabditis remanei TaxID=31234 RepID=E3LNV8_CAERE|nr:CRE-NHR-12 protein [Caenorhabditis remanei]
MSIPREEQKVEPFHNVVIGIGDIGGIDSLDAHKIEPATPPTVVSPAIPTRLKYEKPNCAVCNEVGDGLHFGAEACRACTAFFRRSVALNKKYECRAGGNCAVASNIRCICRSCRFDKCISVGMNPECVQNRRDTLDSGKDEPMAKSPKLSDIIMKPIAQFNSPQMPQLSTPSSSLLDFSVFKDPSTSNFSAFSPASLPGLSSSPSLETMPLLERMRINYEKMENARSVIHRREGENIFQQKVPRPINFRQATECTTKEVSLVADWVEWCFDDFGSLPVDQKTILFQNFFIYFCMLERAFMTVKSGKDGICVMASKDYIDYNNLEGFFEGCGSGTSGTPADIAKLCRLIRPSFDLQKRSLINLMRIENVDNYEFFALCVMLFWDFGLEGQSDACNEVGRRVKHRVTREMTFYLRNVKKHEEPMYRMASVVSILPSLQRAVRRFQEDIEMASIFNIYALPANFYNIVNGKFT